MKCAVLVLFIIFASCGNPVDTGLPDIINSPNVGRLILIKGGTFMMGSPEDEPERSENEGPQHEVRLNPFYIGRYPVTQAQYFTVMGINPSIIKGSVNANRLPVENVSWYDAIEFCNILSEKEKLVPYYLINKNMTDRDNYSAQDTVKWMVNINSSANGYRLPSEAQWEYACRAGTTTAFNWGINQINTNQANFYGRFPLYNDSPGGAYPSTTTSVGRYPPNKWGLYDMHGNVFEWCWDWDSFDSNYYEYSPDLDPEGPYYGVNRVMRGGSWFNVGRELRSAYREGNTATDRRSTIGFRVVRNIPIKDLF